MKFLKNYTSTVPVSQTIYRIEQVLIKCGVSGIAKEYDPDGSGKIVAIVFAIPASPDMPPMNVRLPANEEQAQNALWLDYADGDKLTPDGQRLAWNNRKRLTRADFKEQAERTAWKIVQDWVEVQMSMIQMKQADTAQVFLPYIFDGRQTLYQRIKERGFKALLPERSGGES